MRSAWGDAGSVLHLARAVRHPENRNSLRLSALNVRHGPCFLSERLCSCGETFGDPDLYSRRFRCGIVRSLLRGP
jgi:hypothetical protein